MKRIFDRTFWLYVLLGLVNFLFCNAVMLFVNIRLSLPEGESLLLEFSLQTLISLFLNRFVTFRGCEISKLWPLFSLLIVGVCYVLAKVLLRDLFYLLLERSFLQSVCVWLREVLRVQMPQAEFNQKLVMIMCTFTYSVINYIGQRYLVFRPDRKKEESA